jgi:peptidoglycan hydrolase-like protein with peptidoglycan-binding domain
MGSGTPRSVACAVIAVALIAALPPTAEAKPKHKHPFGSRVLRPGTKGKDVRYLQRALTRLGISTAVDGAYGKGTMKSVEALESQRAWPVNGVVSRRDAKRISRLVSKVRVSGAYFVQGLVSPTLTVRARHAGNVKVKVLDPAGSVVQTIPVSFDGAESRAVSWNGMTATGFAGDAIYRLKLGKSNTAGATASGQTEPFALHLHAFPVPGPHNFGGADARFGAPRSGHPSRTGHPGILRPEGDRGRDRRRQGERLPGIGRRLLRRHPGRITGTDSVYMHLQRPSWAPAGTIVYAGQQIGRVGATGDAQGCHLHFERWTAPGWFSGGAPYDPLPELVYWDSYS